MPYTKPTLIGYNANPPSDDGAQTASNRVDWAKHLDKIGNPLRAYIDAVNNEVAASIGSASTSVATIAEMQAIQSPQDGLSALVLDQNRGGLLVFRTNETGAADGITTFKADDGTVGSWVLLNDDVLALSRFGETTDAAITTANASTADVFVPNDVAATGFLRREAWGPGKIMVNGANTASNNATGLASIAPRISGLSPRHNTALLKLDDKNYRGYIHLGGSTWQVCNFANSGLDAASNVTPFGWNETQIEELAEVIVNLDPGVTKTGTWDELTDGSGTSYVGHLAAQTLVAGDYVEIEFSNTETGGLLEVGFTGRTSGGYIKVEIDGSSALVNQLEEFGDPAYKFFDSYTATDLSFKQRVLVATNLPAKTTPYTLRLTLMADKNPSAGAGQQFLWNCIFLNGANHGLPWSDFVRPKPWIPSTVYAAYEEVVGAGGRVYITVAGGTSGTTQPSHTTGTQSDGGVDWLLIAQSSFVTRSAIIQAKGSQLEYAYEFKPDGEPTLQDIGGNVHGNEYLTGLRIVADGIDVSLALGEYAIANEISLIQSIFAYYGTVDDSPVHVADTVLTHHMVSGRIVISHESTFQVAGQFGYHYPAMWPLITYDAIKFVNALTEMSSPQAGRIDVLDYAGQSNPFVGRCRDFQMRASGDIYRANGTSTTPQDGPGAYRCVVTLTIDPESVADYEYGNLLASIAPNIAGRTTNVGFQSWPMKMYFTRSNTSVPESVTVGHRVAAINEYHVGLFRK